MNPLDPGLFEDIRGVPGVGMTAPGYLALVMWGLHHPDEMRAEESAFIPVGALAGLMREKG